jgi:hypothetical protein
MVLSALARAALPVDLGLARFLLVLCASFSPMTIRSLIATAR